MAFNGDPPRPKSRRALRQSNRTGRLSELGRPAWFGLLVAAVAITVLAAATGVVVTMAFYRHNTAAEKPGDSGASPNSVEFVAGRVLPGVVKLETRLGPQSQDGSGVVLSPDCLIITNAHVVSNAAAPAGGPTMRPITLVRFSDGRTAPFTVVGSDPRTDIAVIRCQGLSDLTTVPTGSSAGLRVGQQVVAIGSPLGLAGTVTSGVISALNRPVFAGGDTANQTSVLDAIQTDAAINPGNSGGALANMDAELVGINAAIATLSPSPGAAAGSIGLGFAIPIDQARRIAGELIATGRASHAGLGVQVIDLPTAGGAKIAAVDPRGAAAAAGIPVGAIVTEIDGRVLAGSDDLIAAVQSHAPGDRVELRLLDPSGRARTASVTLGRAD